MSFSAAFISASFKDLADPSRPEGDLGESPQVQPGISPPFAQSDTSWPTILGYEIQAELGRGAMGVVYRARNLRLDRVVALKMILTGEEAGEGELARFLDEARAIARVQHPNIVQVFEVGEVNRLPFCALEFVAGTTLAAALKGEPQDPTAAAARVSLLARAMYVVHTAGLIHRDLKPANILVATDGTPKITDFGLAKRLEGAPGRTLAGRVVGTPSYMAPEQAAGDNDRVGPVSDIWALGVILYEMLTGRPPFRGTGIWETIAQVIMQEPVPVRQLQPNCPRDLETVCLKCLEKKPEKRYQTAAELADDLARYLGGHPILARPAGPVERAVKWARRSPAQAGLGLFVVACVVMVVIVAVLWAQTARQDSILSQQDADISRRELAEGRRREDIQKRLDELLAKAQRDADAAAWDSVAQALRSALQLADEDPDASAGWPLRATADALLARADAALATAQRRAAEQDKFTKLGDLHADAVFYATLATGLGLDDNLSRARRAAADGLGLFHVTPDGDGPPRTDPGLLRPDEVQVVRNRCYELLLIDAEALARPIPGETAGALRGRVQQALTRLTRADQLLTGTPTRSSLARRAEYLKALGRDVESHAAEERAKATEPVLAGDHFLIGLEYHRQDEFSKAVPALAAALRAEPGHYGAQYLLAVCQLRLKQPQDAKVGLTRCLDQRPEFVWPRLLRATAEMELARLKEGDYAVARVDLDAVLTGSPDASARYVALTNRGTLGMYQHDWNAAIADLSDAIRQRPDALPAHINLALTHRQRADDSPWRADLLVAAPLPFGVVLVAAARAEHRARAFDEAVLVLDKAIPLRPTESRLYHERGQLHLLRGDTDKAREDLIQAIARAPNLGRLSTMADDLLQLGKLLHDGGKYAAAARTYAAVLKIPADKLGGDRRALSARRLTEPLLALGQWREAASALDLYLSLAPTTEGRALPPEQARQVSDALKARGLIHADQKDMRAAAECYTRGLGLVRGPELLTLRGWTYVAIGVASLAETDFDEALQLRPGDADALIGRADARARLGRMREAVVDAEEGLRKLPEGADPKTRLRLRFNAARVFAQTTTRSTDPTTAVARTVGLLREVLADVPPAERIGFWREIVLADPSLARISGSPEMRGVAAETGVGAR